MTLIISIEWGSYVLTSGGMGISEGTPGFKRKGITMDSISGSMRSMGKGSWVVLVILLLLLAGTVFVSYLGWTGAAGTDVPASGYVALVLGVVFSLVVGFGL